MSLTRSRWFVPATMVAFLLGGSAWSYAANITVSSTADSGAGSLRAALLTPPNAGDVIVFTVPANSTITLASPLPTISVPLTINGSGSAGLTVSGAGTSRVFFVDAPNTGTVTISNMSITNGAATGGAGGNSAGGGLGAGGAVFVNSTSNVVLDTVTFNANKAVGGAGGNAANVNAGGGGGGLGGAGASGAAGGGGGGGGGFGAAGGAGSAGGGGGGGVSSAGAAGGTGAGGGGGADGGAAATAGGAANGGNGGATGGGGGGGLGGTATGTGGTAGTGGTVGSAGTATAGGAGGAAGTNGGGGGGGAGVVASGTVAGGAGGAGAKFGGGGGGGTATGGAGTGNAGAAGAGGAFGGGGGGAGATGTTAHTQGAGGNGGFGGGAGAGGTGAANGTAGFGGGAAGTVNDGNSGGGSGGSAFGGAVYAREGATLTIRNSNITGSTLTGGAAGTAIGTGTAGTAGSTSGSDLFVGIGVTGVLDVTSGSASNTGSIAGAGSVQKTGAGTYVLNGGTVSVTGGTNVTAGTMQNMGTFLTALNISSGAALTGTGTSAGTAVSGIISPGVAGTTNIGTLHTGAYQQNSGSIYNVDITNVANNSDKIASTGAAILSGGTVNVNAAAGAYAIGTSYQILTATSGVAGQFSGVTSNLSPYFLELVYLPQEVDLLYAANFESFATTPNQLQVARTIDSAINAGAPTADFIADINQLGTLSQAQFIAALNHLDGQIYGSQVAVRNQVQENWIRMLSDRIRPFGSSGGDGGGGGDMRMVPMSNNSASGVPVRFVDDRCCNDDCDSGCCSCCCTPACGWWDGYGTRGVVGNDGNASGFDFVSGGTGFGFEHQLNECLLVGVAGGYADTHVDVADASSRTHIDGYSAAAYGRHVFDCFYELAALSYTREVFDTNRDILIGAGNFGTAHAGYEGNAYTAYIEQGMLLCCDDGCKLQPLVAIQYINLQQNAFRETGAGALGLNVNEQTADSLRGIAGVRLARCCDCFSAHVDARYEHEWLDDNGIVTAGFAGAPGSAFIIRGNTLGKDFGVFGGGLAVCCSDHCKLTGNYEFTMSIRETSHNGIAGLEFTW